MLILGFWQLDRKRQKEQRLAQVDRGATSDVLTLTEAMRDPDRYIDYTVAIRGTADQRLFFIDNKTNSGKPGYHVLQSVRTDLGNVLINLGWVYASERNRFPEVERLSGATIQHGVLSFPSDNPFVKETNNDYGNFPVVLQQIDIAEIENHLDVNVLPFILLANPDPSSPFVREWEAVVMSPEKHLGYAIQWFGLAVAALTIYLISIGNYYKKTSSFNI